eukprot:tig00001215_g7586.t1
MSLAPAFVGASVPVTAEARGLPAASSSSSRVAARPTACTALAAVQARRRLFVAGEEQPSPLFVAHAPAQPASATPFFIEAKKRRASMQPTSKVIKDGYRRRAGLDGNDMPARDTQKTPYQKLLDLSVKITQGAGVVAVLVWLYAQYVLYQRGEL